tara:strand:+ start:1581 stop:2477 length:897 start_codon:yes stop_codon:yes gene_type:complete
MYFRTEKLILEGPDLTGKTSLYNQIHKKSRYEWNIQDRSALSMVCYARQFERDTTNLKRDLYKEITNLNNRLVILLPDFSTIESRYQSRGDDIQSIDSLKVLYSIFEDEVKYLEKLPNVLVIRSSAPVESIADAVMVWLNSSENTKSSLVGQAVGRFVESASGNEHTLQLETSGKILDFYDKSILLDPLEGYYYKKIERDFANTIEKELDGLNEYNLPQDMSSRRFYYSSTSCISSLHFKPRGKILEFICTFRSTDAQKNGSIDFQFLEYLVHKMGNEYFLDCEDYRIVLRMNSAHLR